jgi:hypothetical protein
MTEFRRWSKDLDRSVGISEILRAYFLQRVTVFKPQNVIESIV